MIGQPAEAASDNDEFFIDRFIRAGVLAGFGNYKAVASADPYDVAVFLFLKDDYRSKIRDFLSGEPSRNKA